MSIIRPFRADDLFRFNNMCVAFPHVSSHSMNAMTLRAHRLPFPAISTSGPKRCVTFIRRRRPMPRAPTRSDPQNPLSRPSVRASQTHDVTCHALLLISMLITHTRTTVWPRLLFQLPLEMARHVLYGPAPKRSTNGIWYVRARPSLFSSFSYRAVPCHAVPFI
jgi:hypothetical protein